MRRPPRTRTAPVRRPGFTMVELMVVILIIAILMALLLPAVFSAVRAANDARVSAEEQNLQTALADFKNKYGEYPPSRIILVNSGDYSPGNKTLMVGTTKITVTNAIATGDITYVDLFQRTVRAMRKYFPRAGGYFNSSGPGIAFPWTASANGYVILQGDECLVFFLGGMPQSVTTGSGSGWGMSGFNRDPANPFTFASASVTANRTVPLFEFAPQRLVDADGDGFPSYVDPLSLATPISQARTYAYFSAYGNNGYDPNDLNQGDSNQAGAPLIPAELDDSGTAVGRQFLVSFAIGTGRVATSTAPNPYTVGDADPSSTTVNTQWANPQTFQLISAGRDGLWGLGGPYDASSSGSRLPVGFANDPSNAVVVRKRERDNITNFAGGRLD